MTDAAAPPARAGRRINAADLVLLAGLLLVWHLAATLDVASDRVLPLPSEVADAMADLLRRSYFYENLWATVRVLGTGMVIAVAGGIGFACVLGLSPVLRDGVAPVVVVLNTVPKVALVPLLTVVMGFSYRSRIVVVVLVAFFPVFLNTLSALRQAREDRDRLMRSLGAGRARRLRMHAIPEGAPAIFAGIKLSLTFGFIATIFAELLIQRDGLAYLITSFRISLNTPMMWAVTVAVGALGMALYFAVDRIERRLVFWERSVSLGGDRP